MKNLKRKKKKKLSLNSFYYLNRKILYIGKVKIKKSSLPLKIVTGKTEILGEKNIGNEFNNFFTDIGSKLTKKIPKSSLPFESYMKKAIFSEMENKSFYQ